MSVLLYLLKLEATIYNGYRFFDDISQNFTDIIPIELMRTGLGEEEAHMSTKLYGFLRLYNFQVSENLQRNLRTTLINTKFETRQFTRAEILDLMNRFTLQNLSCMLDARGLDSTQLGPILDSMKGFYPTEEFPLRCVQVPSIPSQPWFKLPKFQEYWKYLTALSKTMNMHAAASYQEMPYYRMVDAFERTPYELSYDEAKQMVKIFNTYGSLL